MSADSTHTPTASIRRVKQFFDRFWIGLWTLFTFLFLYAPVVVIVVFSFEQGAYSSVPWDGFTLKWYSELTRTSTAIQTARNSILVAVPVTILGTAVATLGAVALVRVEFRLKSLFRMVVLAPMTIPALILAISLLLFYNFVGISRGLLTIIAGQLVFVVPFVLLTVSARMSQFDPVLEEAARDLGASVWTTYRRITLPLLLPGIVSGALLAFALSFDDFLIAFFNGGAKSTLPVYIFSIIRRGSNPVINAISSVALFVSVTIILISELFQR